jgi:hypothetical protein
MYTHIANNDGTCDIFRNDTKVDTVGPWETQGEADAWGSAICDKYNSREYKNVEYPDSLPEEGNN